MVLLKVNIVLTIPVHLGPISDAIREHITNKLFILVDHINLISVVLNYLDNLVVILNIFKNKHNWNFDVQCPDTGFMR